MKLSGSTKYLVLSFVFFLLSNCAVLGPDKDNGGGWVSGGGSGGASGPVSLSLSPGNTVGTTWLAGIMDQYHTNYQVYSDVDSPGNHFVCYGGMGYFPTMNTRCTTSPHSGNSCIQITSGYAWGGYYFMNGVLSTGMTAPTPNWGTVANAGVTNLVGATALTFWARGATGGETAEFFFGGVGWSGTNKTQPYPDSCPQISLGYVTLTTTWTKYTINLSGKDISYVLGAFGVGMSQVNRTIYIDDISFNKSRTGEPRLLESYKVLSCTNTYDISTVGTSYTYDNALAVMAFLAAGENTRAALVADALVYAQDHDRYYTDGRMRNAYRAGDIMLPPGWTPNGITGTVPMHAAYNAGNGSYQEDEADVSSDTGNQAWAMLAWLAAYNRLGGTKYLNAAAKLGDWIDANLKDTRGAGGYMGKFKGWEPNAALQTYKSTEHNLDLYAAFRRLYDITADSKWLTRANCASNFCMSMWSNSMNVFLAGTRADGVTPAIGNGDEPVPLDAQAWMLLSFRMLWTNYYQGLTVAENNCKYPGTWGFDFNIFADPWNSHPDGIWYEGTSQMAEAYLLTGQASKYSNVLTTLVSGRAPDNGTYAAGPSGHESISTGFYIGSGEWRYYRREHVGATAWAALAEKRANPFWLGTTNEEVITANPTPPVQPRWVYTVAGNGTAGYLDATGTNARFNSPCDVAVDSSGNFYVADRDNNCIRKIASGGVVTTLAGNPYSSGSADGTGTNAKFNYPSGLTLDNSGNIIVADTGNNRIRKVTTAGVVTTIAGSVSGYLDETGVNAKFMWPYDVAVDSFGNIFVVDQGNNRIRKVTPAGVVTTFAGSYSGYLDGTGINAQFNWPEGIVIDSTGNIFIGDYGNNRIRKITSAGVVTTFAGSGTMGWQDGTGTSAQFYCPTRLTRDSANNLYIQDHGTLVRKITPTAVVTTYAGLVGVSGTQDGDISIATFSDIHGMACDSAGNLYVADASYAHRIRKITP